MEVDRALGLIRDGTGVAILGVAGVGKSRLLHEVVGRAFEAGMGVVSVAAAASTHPIPFAPFVELLPEGPTPDELAMLGAARQELADRAGSGGLLLAVDDAHHLDRTSLAFLISIASSRTATIAIAARTSEPLHPDLVDLWTNGVIERIDVSVLDRESTDELVGARLGRVSLQLEDELWRLSQGNPLVLHEVLEGAVGSGIRKDDDGVWVDVGPLTSSPRLSDLVLSRLRSLPDPLRRAMETVSVGSPLPLGLATAIIGDDLARLEDLGFAQIVDMPGEPAVIPGHPLYGEILGEHLGRTRSREAYRRIVNAALAMEEPTDPLRVCLWQRAGDHWVSEDVVLAGAQEALLRHDAALAGELLERLDADDDSVGVLLGRSLSYRQRFEEAEAVLSGRSPDDPTLIAEIASIRGQNLAFGLRDIEAARTVFSTEATKIDDPDLRARLTNERAMVSAVQGDFQDAMGASRSVLDDQGASDVPRTAAYVTLTVALAMTADCDAMDAVIPDANAHAQRTTRVLPFAPDQIEIMHVVSMVNAGRINDALHSCRAAIQREQTPAMVSTLLAALLLVHQIRGSLGEALEVGERLLPLYAASDPFGLEPQSHGLIALVRGQMGDVNAGKSVAGLGDLPGTGPRVTLWVDRGRAWAAAARGELDEAARIVLDSGRQGVVGEHYAWAAMCFHDAVRFGRPELVIDELMPIDGSRGADYVVALQEHATALVRRDRDRLDQVASQFGEMSAHLIEAEAWADSTRLYSDAGDDIAAARSCVRSKVAEANCREAQTPALLARPDIVSDREFDVATDASSGLTSAEIAERRFISVRTVDNHLRSVYRKLSISGREELERFVVVGQPTKSS